MWEVGEEMVSFSAIFALIFFSTMISAQPAVPRCDEEVYKSAASGYLTSQRFPSNYSSQLYCIQKIVVDEGFFVQLIFDVFDTEPYADTVTLFEGDGIDDGEIAYLSGTQPMHSIYRTLQSNVMTILFQSDIYRNYVGYMARYDQIDHEEVINPKLRSCRQSDHKNKNYGVLVSPNWPELYPNQEDCMYDVHFPKTVRKIHFRFNFFETEENSDTLSFYDPSSGKLLRRVSKVLPMGENYTVDGNEVTVRFISDQDNQFRGFSITYVGE